MINGIINIKKEKGYTSHDVVAKLRGILKQKKIGHTGTLDPDATGVLPVCLGHATKLCDLLTDKSKEYHTTFCLGFETDTQDSSGAILAERKVCVTKEQVEQVIQSYVGESLQIPPMYSALKVNGQKLCDLARQGKVVERKPRPITITSIVIEDITLPHITMSVACSKGTYIRTLCHDIGQQLECGAMMCQLTRTRVGSFTLQDAITLQEVEELVSKEAVDSKVITVESFYAHLPQIMPKKEYVRMLDNGNRLYPNQIMEERVPYEKEQVRVVGQGGDFRAVYEWSREKKCYSPFQMFQSGASI